MDVGLQRVYFLITDKNAHQIKVRTNLQLVVLYLLGIHNLCTKETL